MTDHKAIQTLHIRQAIAADLAQIVAIYNDAVARTTATYDYEPRSLDEQRAVFEDKTNHGFPMFVALDTSERVVGFSTYGLYRPRPGWRFAVEHSIYVVETARGMGLGPRLMQPVIDHARERGFHTMVGVVDASNAQSIAMHRKCGFELAGIIKQGGFKFDRWLDVAFMQRML